MTDTAKLNPTRPFYWLIRREAWENRYLFITPLTVAAVMLFGFLIAVGKVSRHVHFTLTGDSASQDALLAPYNFFSALVMLVVTLVSLFYSLGALYNERRDRSILFWKSLPISDRTTVLSKITIPLVVMPGFALALILVLHLAMLLINTVSLSSQGQPIMPLWGDIASPGHWLTLAYLLGAMALWHAPLYAWLLLVSAWARRTPFLWAFLPPLGLCLLEKIVFDTGHLIAALGDRVTGGYAAAFGPGADPRSGSSALSSPDVGRYLATPGLWIGLLVAAGFLALAVWQRRNREPI